MIKLDNVSYKVKEGGKDRYILRNVSLEIESGDIIVVTGHNGSGKSTLMKIIMGILPVTSGKIYLDGKDITDMDIAERARLGIAYAFQTPVRFKGLKVRDLISTAQKTNSKIMDVCNYLSRVGLCARDYIDRELNDKLSGGELKRIEIATTFARGARLNIFDEPEAGIDLWSFDGLISAFEENKGEGGTNIIISHQEKIIGIADKVLVLDSGNVVAYGDRESVMPNVKTRPVCSMLQGGSNE
ncbi:MAG: ATP-binding cassette domain-containing protein [Clostridiales bacterium]|nr:ATP-binding cassette domain-containing protein [Clostridiales bacterium]